MTNDIRYVLIELKKMDLTNSDFTTRKLWYSLIQIGEELLGLKRQIETLEQNWKVK